MQILTLLTISSYLHSINIAAGIKSNQQIIKSTWEERPSLHGNMTAQHFISGRDLTPADSGIYLTQGSQDPFLVRMKGGLHCGFSGKDSQLLLWTTWHKHTHTACGWQQLFSGQFGISTKVTNVTILLLGISKRYKQINWYRHSKVLNVVFAITKKLEKLNGHQVGTSSINRILVIVVQSLSYVRLFCNPWIAAHQASLSSSISQSLLKFMSLESVMLSNHLILCHPILLLPSIFPSIRGKQNTKQP